jgi:hypothetical protein
VMVRRLPARHCAAVPHGLPSLRFIALFCRMV